MNKNFLAQVDVEMNLGLENTKETAKELFLKQIKKITKHCA